MKSRARLQIAASIGAFLPFKINPSHSILYSANIWQRNYKSQSSGWSAWVTTLIRLQLMIMSHLLLERALIIPKCSCLQGQTINSSAPNRLKDQQLHTLSLLTALEALTATPFKNFLRVVSAIKDITGTVQIATMTLWLWASVCTPIHQACKEFTSSISLHSSLVWVWAALQCPVLAIQSITVTRRSSGSG